MLVCVAWMGLFSAVEAILRLEGVGEDPVVGGHGLASLALHLACVPSASP